MKIFNYFFVLSTMLAASLSVQADERGDVIVREMQLRDSGFVNSIHEAKMVLKNRQGETSERFFTLKTLEVADDGDKEVGIFRNPPDIRGTAILTFSHGLQPDDQWIFLPSIKRVKRISSSNKSGPFVGSEFAYEDLASWEIDKFSYQYIKDETVDDHDCFVVEFRPAYEDSGYTRQVWWIDKSIYQARKIEFYDRKNALLKVLSFNQYQQYLDKFWRPRELLMENVQTGKSTVLVRSDYQFGTELSEYDFTDSALKNIR